MTDTKQLLQDAARAAEPEWCHLNWSTRVLVSASGEVLAEIHKGVSGLWSFKGKSYISEDFAKDAAAAAIGRGE